MKLVILAALTLVLCGCNPNPNVEISTAEWVCSRTGDVQRPAILPMGKFIVPTSETVIGCVQWTRMEVKL